MYVNNETIDTLTARHFALEACVAALVLTHPSPGDVAKELTRISEAMRAQLLHSKLPETALSAFEQTVANMRKVL